MRTALASAFATALALAGSAEARRYLDVPAVTWEELAPYVEASVVPVLRDDRLDIIVCTGPAARDRVHVYDETLGDFAKVPIAETLRTDQRAGRGFSALAARARARQPSLTAEERATFTDAFYEKLWSSKDFTRPLRARFERASGINCATTGRWRRTRHGASSSCRRRRRRRRAAGDAALRERGRHLPRGHRDCHGRSCCAGCSRSMS